MKKLVLLITFAFFTGLAIAQTKTVTIYENGLTHTNIKADITYNSSGQITSSTAYFTVSVAEMWTNAIKTTIVYSGTLADMKKFVASIDKFATENRDIKNAQTTICGKTVQLKRVMGVKCIVITSGSETINTNFTSISEALAELNKY